MRKILYAIATVALTVFAASCAREVADVQQNGDLVEVSFNVAMPNAVATKAISDGETAKKLEFRVYDAAGKHLTNLDQTVDVNGKQATVNVKLVGGLEYQFVFWAQKAGQYTIAEDGTITLDPAGMMNSDDWDAFYAKKTMEVTAAFNESITLTRPFAQINVGAVDGDLQVASDCGIDLTTLTSKYIVSKVNTKLNLLDGTVSTPVENVEITAANYPAAKIKVGETDYDHVAMLYVLAGEKETVNVDLKLQFKQNGADKEITRTVPNTPIQRNYRTNILGNIFTIGGVFTIIVDPDFAAPDYNEQAGMTIAKANAAFENGQTSVTIDTDPATADDGVTTITLPATAEPVRICLNITTPETITIQYAASGDKPASLDLYAMDVAAVTADLPNTTVTVSAGSKITTGTFATAPTTLIIEDTAEVTNLMIKAGNVVLGSKAKVTSINRTEDNADSETVVEVEAGLSKYPTIGTDVRFNKTITGVTIEKTETEATYTVTSEAKEESALQAIIEDNNSDPKKDVVIDVAAGSEIQWECKYSDERTLVATDNTVTETVVIEGNGEGASFRATDNGVCGVQSGDGTIIFRNITIYDDTRYNSENGNNAWEFAYLEWKGKIRCENVVFADAIQIEGDDSEVEFIDCKFIADGNPKRAADLQSNEYAVWVSGCKSAVFENCDFTGFRGPKAHEDYGTEIAEVSFNNCTFHDLSKKPGIALGTLNAATKVSITNCTFTNCQPGDQKLYAYETDTPVANFDFVFENNNVQLAEGVSLLGANSYGISSAAGLTYAADNLFANGGTFTLTGDIDMTGVEYKSPNVTKAITFDGNGKSISNITIVAKDNVHAGLFGRVATEFTIKNVTIDGGSVTSTNNVDGEYSAGAIIGWLEIHSDWTADILNCTVKNVTVNSCKYVGGVVGYESANKKLVVDGCTVDNCTLNSEYTENGGTSFKGHCGGLVGYLSQGSIKNSTVSNTAFSAKGDRIGALAGTAQANSSIGTGCAIKNVTINGTKATNPVGSVDSRTDKSNDSTIIIE